ncbi:MAG: hypothetical protein EUB_02701 [Eubacterium sp.]|uniref:hypothetical protein n=1 Tax=Eubacterium sp. TaxID=142586 RepID=UPI003074D50B
MEEKYYMVIDPSTGIFYFTPEETNAYMDCAAMEYFCEDNRKRNLKIDPEKYNPDAALCITLENYADYIEEYDIPTPPSQIERLQEEIVQQKLATAEAVEKQETDKIELQLAMAEAIEMLAGGGE